MDEPHVLDVTFDAAAREMPPASGATSRLRPRSDRQGAPLSFAQERLWFLDQLDPGSTAFNVPHRFRLSGPLDVGALRKALETAVDRHEILRAGVEVVAGEPKHVFVRDDPFEVDVLDLTDLSDAEVERFATEEARRPFDLAAGPLLRAILGRVGPDEHVLFLTIHHIVSDERSAEVLFTELSQAYEATIDGRAIELPELPVQYGDYAVWQREVLQGDRLENDVAYWREHLGASDAILELPTDRVRPGVQTHRCASERASLAPELTEAVEVLSRREGVTPGMTYLAAFAVLLARYTEREDVLIGVPSANRPGPELERLVGLFQDTLPLRIDLGGDPSFVAVLRRVRDATLGAHEHALPFAKLVEELEPARELSRNPLVQVGFAFHEGSPARLQLRGQQVQTMDVAQVASRLDLTLALRMDEAPGADALVEYSTDLFEPETIQRLLGHLEVLLEAAVADPERAVSLLPLVTEAELALLEKWNRTAVAYPLDVCLHQLFEEQVERSPDADAIVFEGESMSYRELDRRANQLAHRLVGLGVGPDAIVAVCLERSPELVVALLAVLKAGGAYVPLDPDYPAERLAGTVTDAQAKVLVSDRRLAERLPASQATVLLVDRDREAIAGEPDSAPASDVQPENLAYVIYTSGSTGRPKGAMNTHLAVVNGLLWMQDAYRLEPADRVLQKTPFSFDLSVWELFWPLATGACLIVARPGGHRDPGYLIELVRGERVTMMHFVPSLLRSFLEAADVEECTTLRQVICIGEALLPDDQERFFARLPAVELDNLYGPAEAAVSISAWRCERGSDRPTVPIGRPIANTQLHVLDRHLQRTPIGVAGELYIGGIAVGRGYLGRPELTQERFIPDPFQPGGRLYRTGDRARWLGDGNLEFLGRLDDQVKIRGHRIELGEIEATLDEHPAVAKSVVVVRESGNGDKRLAAWFVPARKPAPSAGELRAHLKRTLPDPMVPASFNVLEEVPLNTSGKADRRSLAAREVVVEVDREQVAPRTPLESRLVGLWEELIGVRPIGVTDDFFALGGHSLLAVRLFAAIEKEFDKRLPLASLFQGATVADLARLVAVERPPASNVVPIKPDGSRRPFFCVHGLFGDPLNFRNLALQLGDDQPFYGLRAVGLEEGEQPLTRIEDIAARYVTAVRTVQPEGPYAVGGLCSGGVVAYEMAQQLRAQGQSVDLVALLDVPALDAFEGDGSSLRDVVRGFFKRARGAAELTRSQWRDLLQTKFVQTRTRLRGRRLASAAERQTLEVDDVADFLELSAPHRAVGTALSRALAAYAPDVYPGRLTLFRPRFQPLFGRYDIDDGWKRLAGGGLEIKATPGNALGMLTDPHVRALSRELRAALDEASAGG